MADVSKLSTGRLLDGIVRHPTPNPSAEPLPELRLVWGFCALIAAVVDCRAGEPGEPFGERDALAALDELQRRAQDAAKALPGSVRTPLVAGLDGLRAAARAAVVASRRGP